MTTKELEQKITELEKKMDELKTRPIENHFHYHYSYPQYTTPYYPNYPWSTGMVYCGTTPQGVQSTSGYINGGLQ